MRPPFSLLKTRRFGLSLAPLLSSASLRRSGTYAPALLRRSASRRPIVLVTSSPLPSAPKTRVLKHSKPWFFLCYNSPAALAVKYSSQLFRTSAFLFSVRGGGSSGPLQPPHRRPLLSSGPKVLAAQSLTVDYGILLDVKNLSRVSENSKEFSPMNGPRGPPLTEPLRQVCCN